MASPARSCLTFASALHGKEIVTLEGLIDNNIMTSLRTAFQREHALQCGFCTPGMLITAYDMVRRLPANSQEDRVRRELNGNLCRCTGYLGIVRAIISVLCEHGRNALDGENSANEANSKTIPGGWVPFEAVREAETTRGASSDTEGVELPELPDGWQRNFYRFQPSLPVQRVWEGLADPYIAVSCLPGGEITKLAGETIEGRIRIGFGPIRATFSGSGQMHRDAPRHIITMQGGGGDGRMAVEGRITCAVCPSEDAESSELWMCLDYRLRGPLAQFSRTGLVSELIGRIAKDFVARLEARLIGRQKRGSLWAWLMRLFR